MPFDSGLYARSVHQLVTDIESLAIASDFSGAIRLDHLDSTLLNSAYGFAYRAAETANTSATVFGVASVAKGLTALTVMALVEQRVLALDTSVRSILGRDLPLIDDAVTIEHLLAHRSGIGDYLDEDAATSVNDYVIDVPVHQLDSPEAFLAVLEGHPQVFRADQDFSYCNSGYCVLAIIAERTTQRGFYELVDELVGQPAGLRHTSFLRSDELPGRVAHGYLDPQGLQTNVLHLPVRGSGDGGVFTTTADLHALWRAIFDGEILSPSTIQAMTTRRSFTSASRCHGLGFWLSADSDWVALEGYDAGISARTAHSPSRSVSHTVLANTSTGAWPIAKRFENYFAS